jgi:hypothetical protein
MSTNNTSPEDILGLLLPLPFSHPAIGALLAHSPFTYPSHLPSSNLSKYLQRLNSTVLSKTPSVSAEKERAAGYAVARELVKMDKEGWVLGEFGKGWIGSVLAVLAVSGRPDL